MNSLGKSSYSLRCQVFQQREAIAHVVKKRKAAVHNLWILTGVILVSAVCGMLFLLRLMDLRGKLLESNTESTTRNRPPPGFLESAQCNTVCYTKACIRTAADILEMLNPEVSPCEDFYQYACGRFKRELTEHKKKERYLWSVEYEAIKFFQDLIRQMPQSVPNNAFGSSVMKLRKFFDSCIDPRSSEENAIPTAVKYLEYFGIKHWPHLNEDYKFRNPDLDEVLIRLFFYELRPLFEVHPTFLVPADPTGRSAQNYEANAERMNIQMAPSRGSIFHSEAKFVNEILESFVPNNTLRNKISAEVFAFDLAVSEVMQRTNEKEEQCQTNGTVNCYTTFLYDCAQGGSQKKDRWCRIAKKILERSGFLEKYPTIPVKLKDGEHFQELGELVDSTDQRIVAYTLAIHFFVEKAISMNFGLRSKKIFHEDPLLNKYFYDMGENKFPFCAMWACYRLPKLAGIAFYYSKYQNSSLRREINEIYSDLKDILHSTLRNISWIDSEAKESLDELFSQIEFSPEIFLQDVNISRVAELYQEVEITEDSFLANDLESQKLDITLQFRNLDMAAKQSGILTYPFHFNPHYSFIPRTIFFEFGNFLLPLVATDRPRYTNLGTLGYVLGHELTHAAEFLIRTLEKSEDFENTLKERKKCLEDDFFQYEVYTTGQKVKGNETYFENIADFLGIRAAFKSLKKNQENHSDGKMLPGLKFNNEKVFFLMTAQNFCEENNKESQKAYLRDRHSPPNVRINALFRNFAAFSRAFDCAAGSPMNPVNKCSFE